MTMVERDTVELPVCRWAEAHGVKHYKMSTQFTRSWPDRQFFIPGGVTVFIEFKRLGGKPTPKQERKITELRALGFPVYVCDSKAQGITILKHHMIKEK